MLPGEMWTYRRLELAKRHHHHVIQFVNRWHSFMLLVPSCLLQTQLIALSFMVNICILTCPPHEWQIIFTRRGTLWATLVTNFHCGVCYEHSKKEAGFKNHCKLCIIYSFQFIVSLPPALEKHSLSRLALLIHLQCVRLVFKLQVF